ncbi:hypothetical protein TNCV_1661461 [Trichonephila clavipes]|nr:hypothetical protein TNCV_1661461 [Trichonephila clavipes]
MERNATEGRNIPVMGVQQKHPVFSRGYDLLTAEQVSQRLPMPENEGVNELLRHCCPFVLQRQSELESLLVVRYELQRLPRKSHTCSMGLRSGDHPANPYVQYPHSPRAVRQLLCDDMCIVVHERNCRPIAPLKRRTYGRRISLQ